jgi:hypothetical protein
MVPSYEASVIALALIRCTVWFAGLKVPAISFPLEPPYA